ncbi:MAG: response regulator transcription factor [Blautia sp.]|nr:response regulator transcription factor [Blautia sp.]
MIYCVEDERNIRELLVYTLGTTGFEAKGIRDGKELKKALKEELPELILLDIMLPGEDGYSILENLKKNQETKDIPVIMVTAKEAEYDKVRGLDSGADDYITKPFGMMEFIARVKAVLRRASKQSGKKEYTYKGLTIHVERHQVFDGERQVELTLKEFELLRFLMENQGIVLSRDQILEKIWGYEFSGETRTVDVHIRTLRQKLGESGFLIETVRGVGYRIGDKE